MGFLNTRFLDIENKVPPFANLSATHMPHLLSLLKSIVAVGSMDYGTRHKKSFKNTKKRDFCDNARFYGVLTLKRWNSYFPSSDGKKKSTGVFAMSQMS